MSYAYYSPSHLSSLPLEPPTRPQYRHTLIHHPFSHTQVAIDPFLHFFALGYLILLEARAEIPTSGDLLAMAIMERRALSGKQSDTLGIAKQIGLGYSIRETG